MTPYWFSKKNCDPRLQWQDVTPDSNDKMWPQIGQIFFLFCNKMWPLIAITRSQRSMCIFRRLLDFGFIFLHYLPSIVLNCPWIGLDITQNTVIDYDCVPIFLNFDQLHSIVYIIDYYSHRRNTTNNMSSVCDSRILQLSNTQQWEGICLVLNKAQALGIRIIRDREDNSQLSSETKQLVI